MIGFQNLSPLLVIKNPSKSHRFVASTEVENEGPDKSCTTISFYGCLLLSHLIFNLIPIKETKIALNLKAFSNTDKLINILLERQLRYMFSCRSICIICIATLFYLLPQQLNAYSEKQQQFLGQESPFINWEDAIETIHTIMHSSRKPTVHCSGRRRGGRGGWVYPSMHWAGGVCPGGCLSGGGGVLDVCPGEEVSAAPPVDRMTDACENITLPQLRCGR